MLEYGSDDQTFLELQEPSCEVLCSSHAKVTVQAMEGSSDSANVTVNLVLVCFPSFSQLFPVLPSARPPAATSAAASDSAAAARPQRPVTECRPAAAVGPGENFMLNLKSLNCWACRSPWNKARAVAHYNGSPLVDRAKDWPPGCRPLQGRRDFHLKSWVPKTATSHLYYIAPPKCYIARQYSMLYP